MSGVVDDLFNRGVAQSKRGDVSSGEPCGSGGIFAQAILQDKFDGPRLSAKPTPKGKEYTQMRVVYDRTSLPMGVEFAGWYHRRGRALSNGIKSGASVIQQLVSGVLVVIFLVLGLWHIYWALGGQVMKSAAIPSIESRGDNDSSTATFEPGPLLTALVGFAILGMGLLVAAASGIVASPLPPEVLGWGCFALAVVFLLRAIGDFRYVGFFKKVKNSDVSRYDTMAYSPLCCLLAVGLTQVGLSVTALN